MILLDHQKELTVETLTILIKSYIEASSKSYASMEMIYRAFRTKWPVSMFELMKKKETEWNLYVDKEPYDLEHYIQSTWESHGMHVPSYEHIHAVINDLSLSYKKETTVFHTHQMAVW
jgi:hypothetical protein